MPLRQLYHDPNAESIAGNIARVDIVAVHGLNSRSKKDRDHAWDTWYTTFGSQGRLWLRDDLPQSIPESRIFLYEYNSIVAYGKSRDTFIDKANELLEWISVWRAGVESRPIVFLGHSLGGLLIKQALINAHNNPKYTPIKNATTGLIFFATPHPGGDWMLVNLGVMVAKIATAVGFQKGDDVLETLKSGSIFSDIMQQHWRHQLLKYDIISFWGAVDEIVPLESTQLNMPGHLENVVMLNADHSGVCKFGDSLEDHDNFELVRSNIKDLCEKALKTGQQLKRNQVIRQQQAVIIRDDHDAAYNPLKPNEVRFLVLRSGSYTTNSSKNAIEVEFHVESTDSEKIEAYEALSYVWGGSPLDSADSAYTVRVWIRYITYVELPITWNLYYALLALRGPKNRRLWADALCINQRNDVERSEQVAKMGWIYQHAANVLIFLGGEPPRNSGADEYINRMLTFVVEKKSKSEREKEQLLAVSALLTRPWFSRRWVVQEVALARKATVIIPGFTSVAVYNWEMPWVDFADAVTLFSRRRAAMVKHLTPDDAFGFGEIHALGAASLVDITNNLHRKDSGGRILERLLDLESLLTKIPMFEVTQIHDAVYAVLGLAKDTQSRLSDSKPPIHIDYHTSPAILFASVVRFIIAQSNSLDILCRPWAPSSSDLPSWIATVVTYPYARRPDGQYHRQYANTLVGSPSAKGKFYNASRELYRQSEEQPITDGTFERLVVTGVEFDQILSVGGKAINGNTPADWIIMAGWKNVNDECPPDFWRTVVADRGPDGENAPSWYRRACQHVYRKIGNMDLDTSKMITTSLSDDADFLRRMQSIIWGRRFFKTHRGQPGLGPPGCKKDDIVAILCGCSVPVILRRVAEDQSYKLVGECYLQGCMDGDIDAIVENTRIFTLV